MQKYKRVFVNSVAVYVAYRLNFFLWRLRVVISVLISYYLWFSVFQTKNAVFGYQQNQILTYILLITFLNAVVLTSSTANVAQEIQDGSLSNQLVHPMNYFGFNFARDLADKMMNSILSILEIVILIWLLKPNLFLQTHPLPLLLFALSLIVAVCLYFFISMLLSFVGFWSRESWAPRFIFFILVSFLAGTFFPLDIFPRPIFLILRMLPFPYLIFFPLKIYLNQLSTQELFGSFFIGSCWCILLGLLMKLVWNRGIKRYTAERM